MKINFQFVMVGVFVALAVFGVLVFSGTIKIGKDKIATGVKVTLWGTENPAKLAKGLEEFNKANPAVVVKYVQKFPESFDQDLLEALAEGKGPDLFFISNDLAYKYSNKIYTIPYQTYPLATFKNTFVKAGEVFLTSKGVLAFPIAVDPLVMYYNRNILDASGVVYPPATWDEFQNLVPLLTKKDDSSKIIKSTVAMGQFSNVLHAKDILATLFMQLGNPIIAENNGRFISMLEKGPDLSTILKFYTDFTDPLKEVYSWNRSLRNSQEEFSAENLAFYFGFSSEFASLIKKNPNQNFLAATFPQIKNAKAKSTYANVTGIAVASSSKNFSSAFTAASLLATSDFVAKYLKAIDGVPARRDLLAVKQTDAFFPIFYTSALYGTSWLDPSSLDTDDIFRKMIDNVLSNNLTPRDAIKDSSSKLDLLLMK